MEVFILDNDFDLAKKKREIAVSLGFKSRIISPIFDFGLAKKGDFLLVASNVPLETSLDDFIKQAVRRGLRVAVLVNNFPISEKEMKLIINN